MNEYKYPVRLPKTAFSMKASLAEKEPLTLKRWQEQDLYNKINEKDAEKPLFTLHDGPPYANGHLHMGHALNKILKDMVIKYHRLQGFQAPYKPGWDCHGLPIEWMVETEYKNKGINKETIDAKEFRSACRAFAGKWVKIQAEEFQRLGVLGDWRAPYLTMDYASERKIVKKLFQFLEKGSLYKSVKPVYWSVVEQTALAEAEVEYKDKTSPSLYVAFPLQVAQDPDLEGAHAVIWTTTPWTLPANRAIAYHAEITYVLAELSEQKGAVRKIIVAEDLVDAVQAALGVSLTVVKKIAGTSLEGAQAHHPWHGQGYDFDVPLLPGDHVTTAQGTGLVHTAPGHGLEDFALGKKYGIEIAQPVGDDGVYYPNVPLWAGKHVYKVNDEIIASLEAAGVLLSQTSLTHSYPHSWRSKAPLIFRTTPQWFISMEANNLRTRALKTIDEVNWVPQQGRNRIHSMVAGRPDWCLSRQRVWGIPIPVFVHKETQEILCDPIIHHRILDLIEKEGTDFWFEATAKERVLSPNYDAASYEKCQDILDVWFESGCSYSFITGGEGQPSLPVDLYLEGSDQHRGWFQSSLLVAQGTDEQKPYKSVLTHGFIVDQDGYKLSKSKGNAVNLADVLKTDGADVLRLWVAGSDYQEDMRLSKDIMKYQQDIYRKLRNTLRFLLGNLPDLDKMPEPVSYESLPLLEKWVLARLSDLNAQLQNLTKAYDIHGIFRLLYTFAVNDLSSFYFDIRKDALYCEVPGINADEKEEGTLLYRSALTVLNHVFEYMVRWLAPIVSFTAEEAWQVRYPGESLFLQELPHIPEFWKNTEICRVMEQLRSLRSEFTWALEQARGQKIIRSGLAAQVSIYLPETDEAPLEKAFTTPAEWADFLIVSAVAFVKEPLENAFTQGEGKPHFKIAPASGDKCERCWKYTEEGTFQEKGGMICSRCASVLKLEK